jgi:glycosyltransferase involved in cell wall biosynthesis
MPKISLIITTFNRPRLLPRAVASAQRAGHDLEVIVVDDGSTDETATVCQTLSGIRYVRLDRNQGVAGARNVGLLECTGDYIAFLDDDDVRLPGSLDRQLRLLENNAEAGFVAGGVQLADQQNVPTGEVAIPRASSGDLFWQILGLNLFLLPASVLVRKSCFFEIGIFNKDLAGIDDWDLWTRIAELRPVVIDEQPVSVYRSATPESGQGSSDTARHLFAAMKHQRQLLTLPRAAAAPASLRRAVRRRLKRNISDTLSWRAAEHLPRGFFRFAAANFFTALRVSPLWAARPTHLRVFYRSWTNQLNGRSPARITSAG